MASGDLFGDHLSISYTCVVTCGLRGHDTTKIGWFPPIYPKQEALAYFPIGLKWKVHGTTQNFYTLYLHDTVKNDTDLDKRQIQLSFGIKLAFPASATSQKSNLEIGQKMRPAPSQSGKLRGGDLKLDRSIFRFFMTIYGHICRPSLKWL